jgi:hypothetical protein
VHRWGSVACGQRRLRRAVPVAARGVLGDYVPFNFCYRSVMLYALRGGHQDYAGGQDPVVHIVSSVQRALALNRPWAFTDRHADLGYAQHFDSLAKLNETDWGVIPLTFWAASDDTMEKRQAEFLVHQMFSWSAVSAPLPSLRWARDWEALTGARFVRSSRLRSAPLRAWMFKYSSPRELPRQRL